MTDILPLDALADPTRRRLFELLRKGPRSVNELVAALPVSQPAVSQHLSVLKDARLVRIRKLGNRRIYSLNPEGLAELRLYVEGLWEDVLGAFHQAAENHAKENEDEPNQSITHDNRANQEKHSGEVAH
jgi:DNA-binding transcriptional ArsR family regulator